MGINLARLSDTCLELRIEGYEQNFLIASDVHWDNPKCDRPLFKRTLDEGMDNNRLMGFNGDTFCLMQGNYDPRKSKSDIRPEHNVNDYLDAVIESGAQYFLPYARNIMYFGLGNHCSVVSRRNETNILKRFVTRLNDLAGTNIQAMPYGFFLRIRMSNNKQKTRTTVFYAHHGQWGGVVSRGTQGANRYGLIAPDADVCFSGHTHDEWVMTIPRFRLKANGEVVNEKQFHVKTGTFKEEALKMSGFHAEKIVMPKALGATLVNVKYEGKNRTDKRIQITNSN